MIPPGILSSLAAKITLPFVGLFAVVFLAMGWVLAREIFSEVEKRVEEEQRFVLEVAAFPGWPLSDDSLRRIRDRARPDAETDEKHLKSELIVLQGNASPLTTLSRSDREERVLLDAFFNELIERPAQEPASETILRSQVNLAGRKFLLLATSRTVRGGNAVPRRFFLLHPYSNIEQSYHRALMRLVNLGAAGLLLATGLGLALAFWIARPLRNLAAAAKRVTTVGLNDATPFEPVHLAPDSRDGGEIGELSQAFRSMLESLRRSQANLIKAERLAATGKLAACVAHEIRNPLTSLRMTVEMLQSAALTGDKIQQAYDVILNEIDRLSLAVEELLTFARPAPAQKQPGSLNALAAATLQFLAPQMVHARIHTALEIDERMPANLLFDPNMLRQLMVNLLLNAQQAIVRNGEIVVRTRWNAPPESSRAAAILEIQDSGPGVAPEIREKVFELFASTKQGGGGLGLTIAKQIVEEHGGTVTFESAPGRTIFRVELPQ